MCFDGSTGLDSWASASARRRIVRQKRSFMAGRDSEGPGRSRDMGAALYRAAETVSCFSISCAGMAAPKSAVSGWRASLRSNPPI